MAPPHAAQLARTASTASGCRRSGRSAPTNSSGAWTPGLRASTNRASGRADRAQCSGTTRWPGDSRNSLNFLGKASCRLTGATHSSFLTRASTAGERGTHAPALVTRTSVISKKGTGNGGEGGQEARVQSHETKRLAAWWRRRGALMLAPWYTRISGMLASGWDLPARPLVTNALSIFRRRAYHSHVRLSEEHAFHVSAYPQGGSVSVSRRGRVVASVVFDLEQPSPWVLTRHPCVDEGVMERLMIIAGEFDTENRRAADATPKIADRSCQDARAKV